MLLEQVHYQEPFQRSFRVGSLVVSFVQPRPQIIFGVLELAFIQTIEWACDKIIFQ